MRLGDLDALKEQAKNILVGESINTVLGINLYKILEEIINNAPTVEPRIEYGTDGQPYRLFMSSAERLQGEWIKITREGTVPVEYVCSCCGRKIYDDYERSIPMSAFYPYCHCGADMRGDKE